ncbi:MAG TPA: ABC transporter permease [Candidatus Angelobacter sp.]|nr:ABC transporter permease [Candidatus Angelobacter sp.]
MNSHTATATAGAITNASSGSALRIYRTEAKYEFMKTLRQPAYVIPTLTFPMVFYLMFGVIFGGKQTIGSVNLATYLLATYATFGVMGASLFGFAVGVAMERGYGWLQVKRASPMPPLAYLAAKGVMSTIFCAILVIGLYVLGTAFGGVHLPPAKFLGLAGIVIAGSIVFCAMGLVIGCYTAPNVAPAVVNVIFLPMSFCAGLWLPLQLLPKVLQHAALLLPPYHLAQLALHQVGFETTGAAWQHIAALAAFTVVFLLLARRGFKRDDVSVNA